MVVPMRILGGSFDGHDSRSGRFGIISHHDVAWVHLDGRPIGLVDLFQFSGDGHRTGHHQLLGGTELRDPAVWSVTVQGQTHVITQLGAPPAITGMPTAGCSLWPPNNKLVQVAVVKATPVQGATLASFRVTGVSNEAPGTDPDIVITGSGNQYTVQPRTQRDGGGTGRIYTLTAVATDSFGSVGTATSTCVVPYDQGK